ncbi:MAG: His-Xaa-Ser system protein HxsD [Myxococcota bacterium]
MKPPEVSEEMADFTFELSDRDITFVLTEALYPRDAIYGAAYLFIDRCYVFLSVAADAEIRVRLRTKEASPADVLEALAGEFANELLNQCLRQRIGDSTKGIREFYMARAFFTDKTGSTIDALLAELDAEELEDDPLEIAVPWESNADS